MENHILELNSPIICPHCLKVLGIGSHVYVTDQVKTDAAVLVGITFNCLQCGKGMIHCCHCEYVARTNRFSKRYLLNGHLTISHSDLFQQVTEEEVVDFSQMALEESGDDGGDDGGDDDISDDGMASCDRSVDYIIPCDANIIDVDSEDEEEDEEGKEAGQWVADDNPNNKDDDVFSTFQRIFGDYSTSIYFYHQYQTANDSSNVPGGVQGLVFRCLAQQQYSLKRCDSQTSKLFFTLLLMMHGSSEPDKELIIDFIEEIFREVTPKLRPMTTMPPLPLTMEEANKLILTKRFSMLRNIPIEGLVKADDIHACSSIDRTIDIMMGLGVRPSFIQNEFGERDTCGINGSNAAQDILQEIRDIANSRRLNPDKVAIGWITLWSGESFLHYFFLC